MVTFVIFWMNSAGLWVKYAQAQRLCVRCGLYSAVALCLMLFVQAGGTSFVSWKLEFMCVLWNGVRSVWLPNSQKLPLVSRTQVLEMVESDFSMMILCKPKWLNLYTKRVTSRPWFVLACRSVAALLFLKSHSAVPSGNSVRTSLDCSLESCPNVQQSNL